MTQSNSPELWKDSLPHPSTESHKYDRGFCGIIAAPELTGATRLAAEAALRSGAGLVRVIAEVRDDIYRMTLPADIMVANKLDIEEKKITAWLAGPGGIAISHHEAIDEMEDAPRILDSSALPTPDKFPLKGEAILTPHGGEFKKMFPELESKKAADVLEAAEKSNTILIAKNAKTIIAHPDGRSVEHDHPNPALARGGTGDVLAGLVAGLVAQGMPGFEAACAAVWIHSEAGKGAGHSFTASDLVANIAHTLESCLAN